LYLSALCLVGHHSAVDEKTGWVINCHEKPNKLKDRRWTKDSVVCLVVATVARQRHDMATLWQLFAHAIGLVTDMGSILAHGSIVAREYGIPAVLGVGQGTQRIKSGDLIAVDGDEGTVQILKEAGESWQLMIWQLRHT
jgi:phosphohistidine swiveling domain-containing protein